MPAITEAKPFRLTEQMMLDANEDANLAGVAQPFCDATDKNGKMCFRRSTGDTDYCLKHETKPHLNYSVNDQCAHENWAGRRCQRRVWPHGAICPQHWECKCDACESGHNLPNDRA